MRVKTPWIDALTQSREAERDSQNGVQASQSVKPDVTPKKMSESYYSAVCIPYLEIFQLLILTVCDIDFAFGTGQMASGYLSKRLWPYSVGFSCYPIELATRLTISIGLDLF